MAVFVGSVPVQTERDRKREKGGRRQTLRVGWRKN